MGRLQSGGNPVRTASLPALALAMRATRIREELSMPIRVRLVLASVLMLFLELALIRWTGANVLHLSYFSNIVLLGSFLGIGLGFLRAQADRVPAPYYSPMILLGLVGFVAAYPVSVDRKGSTLIFFTSLATTGPPIWLTLPAVFLAVAAVMAGPGE